MAITYRTAGSWGSGKGGNLSAAEIDANFYALVQQIAAITTGDTITEIENVNNALTIRTASGGVFGPFSLPKAVFRPRGDWAAATAYAVNDLVVTDDALYMVNVGHTSDSTFSASKMISGVQVYWKVIERLAGADGAAGPAWSPNAIGTYSGLSAHDSEAAGYSYLSTDGDGSSTTLAVVFFKNSATAGDWSVAPFQGPAGAASVAPTLSGFIAGTYSANQVLYQTLGTDYYLPSGLSGAIFVLSETPTSSFSLALKVGGNTVGSVDFTAGGMYGTVTMSAEQQMYTGAQFSITAPSTADATAAGLTFTIPTSLTSASSGGGGGVYVG